MSDEGHTEATDSNSIHEGRNHHLMDELLTGVALDPIKFTKILSMLEHYPPNLSYLAKEMRIEFW